MHNHKPLKEQHSRVFGAQIIETVRCLLCGSWVDDNPVNYILELERRRSSLILRRLKGPTKFMHGLSAAPFGNPSFPERLQLRLFSLNICYYILYCLNGLDIRKL